MKTNFRIIAIIISFFACSISSSAQYKLPEVLSTGTMEEQMEYLRQKTSIYNDFRAVREDIFQAIIKNSLDTLTVAKTKIMSLDSQIARNTASMDSLNSVLRTTRNELTQAVKERDSLFLFGIPTNKTLYNTIMWTLVAGLIVVAVLILIIYNRNRVITRQTVKESEDLKEEFESYRKLNREKIEQMVINHFNEIKKIKGER